MVNIELSQQQAEELKNFYISELDKLNKRSEVIRELLGKLDTEHAFIKLPGTAQVKEITPEKITPEEGKVFKNLKWPDFIINALHEKQKPLTRVAFTELYEKRYNVKIADTGSERYALEQTLYKLRVKDKLIESIRRKGVKGKLYGLTEWTDKPVLKNKNGEETNNISKVTEAGSDSLTGYKHTYNWPQFVKETLIKQKRILTLNELIEYAMNQFNIPEDKMVKTRGNLSPTVSNLRKKKILMPAKKPGFRGTAYGMAEWFDNEGNLIVDYK